MLLLTFNANDILIKRIQRFSGVYTNNICNLYVEPTVVEPTVVAPTAEVTCNADTYSILIKKNFEAEKVQEVDVKIGTGKDPATTNEDSECVFTGTATNAGAVSKSAGATISQRDISAKAKVSDAKSLNIPFI